MSYVSAGRDLLRSAGSSTSHVKHRTMVILADPDYQLRVLLEKEVGVEGQLRRRGAGLEGLQLKSLSGSRKESEWLRQRAGGAGWTVQSLMGAEATELRLNEVRAPTLLHLATHGLFLPELKKSERDWEGPMQRSLLMLAGAQRSMEALGRGRIPVAEQDGLVTAAEIAKLNLEGTWLVVLSACETGQGEALAGEGVLGLRRGFIRAGAQNLLLTLWPVGDRETLPLMQGFYGHLLASEPIRPSLALSLSQRESLKKMRQHHGLSQAVRLAGPFILSR
ncbi:MAG: CHAT domain-containing protein [Blastochloris sp.]|nr:CHAT domain-containing protein [Blastochloris sp.]